MNDFSKLTATSINAILATRLKDVLSERDKGLLIQFTEQLNPDAHEVSYERLQESVFAHLTANAANDAISKLTARANEAAKQERISFEIKVRGGKNWALRTDTFPSTALPRFRVSQSLMTPTVSVTTPSTIYLRNDKECPAFTS